MRIINHVTKRGHGFKIIPGALRKAPQGRIQGGAWGDQAPPSSLDNIHASMDTWLDSWLKHPLLPRKLDLT